jgi:anti-anti-sigma factor
MPSRHDRDTPLGEPAQTTRLGCTVEGAARAPYIHLSGSLDHTTINQFRDAASTHLRDATVPVTVDLSRLDDIDSAGVAACVYISVTARQHDTQVVFLAPTPTVRRVIEYTELDELLTVENP